MHSSALHSIKLCAIDAMDANYNNAFDAFLMNDVVIE